MPTHGSLKPTNRPESLSVVRAPATLAYSLEMTDYTGFITSFVYSWGWPGGGMVLGKLPVPGCPTNLDYSRVRAYCASSGCGWGLFGHFFSGLSLRVGCDCINS